MVAVGSAGSSIQQNHKNWQNPPPKEVIKHTHDTGIFPDAALVSSAFDIFFFYAEDI